MPAPAASLAEVVQEVAAVAAGDQSVAAFERALDGLVRHAHRDRAGLAEALRPIMRSRSRGWSDCRPADVYDVAAALRGDPPREFAFHVYQRHRPEEFSLAGTLLAARLTEAMELVETGAQPFLLAVPTDSTGALDAAVLVERTAELERLGVEAAPVDLAQALLRLTPPEDPEVAAAAEALSSEAGRRLARWLREGGLPHQDSEPADWYRPESPDAPPAPARPGVDLDPWFPPAAAALVGPTRASRSLSELPMTFWWAQLPHHHDEVTARDYTRSVYAGGRRRTRVLPFVAESGGPAGYAVHRALAEGTAMNPHGDEPTVDALLVLAARGRLDAGMLGRQLDMLLRSGRAEPNRVADSLRAAAGTGAYGTVWAVLAAALPGLLRGTPARGVAGLLALAAECVSRCGTAAQGGPGGPGGPAGPGGFPELDAVAGRKGSSLTIRNARLLRDALG
ncbi:hypothetical protein [Phaeacidiphilus oryzae]|uniref:hypothetical protein n=1 Tax=Phaeacidiphilus oryzae TaxID=348818 RepID=UPI00068BB535|nr:hypothetical protein [Phaeacidiphilus oryzae]